jgi:hypothetical protein
MNIKTDDIKSVAKKYLKSKHNIILSAFPEEK